MRSKFWELPLAELSAAEWESLCDRCGKCCLIKLEDEDTGEIVFTSLVCKLFDDGKCQCSDYPHRRAEVPDCLTLTMETIPKSEHWLPKTCAYVRRYNGQALPSWHYLLTGDFNAMHSGGHSVINRTTSEEVIVELEDAIDYIDTELGP